VAGRWQQEQQEYPQEERGLPMSRTFTVTLPDGRRVKCGLKKRNRDRYWVAVFVGPDGRRVERSTAEAKLTDAPDAAAALIRQEYAPSTLPPPAVTWAEVSALLEQHWRAGGLRPETIRRYLSNLSVLATTFPETEGPADITPAHAIDFKIKRKAAGTAPITLATNIGQFRFIWKKWLIKECRLVRENPWAEVQLPKLDRRRPKVVSADQRQTFQDWLRECYPGWRLPHLFLEVKAYLGCRLGELAALEPGQLRAGRVCFQADVSKGRRPRDCKLPPELYQELREVSGEHHVFERFAEELRAIYRRQGNEGTAVNVGTFTPHRFGKWLEEKLIDCRKLHPEVPRWKLHSLRATAISEVRNDGVSAEKAAAFFGVTPRVMAAHYETLNETAMADEVAECRQKKVGGKWGGRNGTPAQETPQADAV
jgi:integrase